MSKLKSQYVCQSCGSVTSRWAGRCGACGAWDSIVEEASAAGFTRAEKKSKSKAIDFEGLGGEAHSEPRRKTGIAELDRVLGGGLVPGSAILIGGDPGIGKSTLLLQAVVAIGSQKIGAEGPHPIPLPTGEGSADFACTGKGSASCSYITGEESVEQVRMRAHRLGIAAGNVRLATATSVTDILAALKEQKPDVVVIDSIQTLYLETLESAPGTVGQVRAAAHELIQFAKQSGAILLLVGHVTKEGQIAGPKVLEHMVDTVLYFEGDGGHPYRILRAVKNRFGGANEIGVFEMTDKGLREVSNPSELFIPGKAGEVSGSVIFAGMEGTRPVLVEIQALVVPTNMATPRRAVVGWDANRLSMLLAVLQRRLSLPFMDKEVYLNVAGGLRITEPAADLAVVAALISALLDKPLQSGAVVFGEVGLSGEVRKVGRADARLKEAEKLGFSRAIVPGGTSGLSKTFILQPISYIRQLREFFPAKGRKPESVEVE